MRQNRIRASDMCNSCAIMSITISLLPLGSAEPKQSTASKNISSCRDSGTGSIPLEIPASLRSLSTLEQYRRSCCSPYVRSLLWINVEFLVNSMSLLYIDRNPNRYPFNSGNLPSMICWRSLSVYCWNLTFLQNRSPIIPSVGASSSEFRT